MSERLFTAGILVGIPLGALLQRGAEALGKWLALLTPWRLKQMPDLDKTTKPWRVKPIQLGKDERYFEVVCGRKTIVQTHAREIATGDVWLAQDEANVRLIAAAPDLLAALKGVLRVADRATEEFDDAHAAIAKAEGKQQ